MSSYNGWSNWETWNTHLWLTNDPSTYASMLEIAQEEVSYADLVVRMNRDREQEDTLRRRIGELMRDSYEDSQGVMGAGAGWTADILCNALDRVNWEEIADAFMEQVYDEQENEDAA